MTRRRPIPGEVLLGEVKERAGDVGVVRNEASVEIGETEERANIFHLGWSGPICDSVKFNRVHGQLTWFNDRTEVFDLVSGKLALFEFQMKVKFDHSFVGGVDENVIHVDDKPAFGNHVMEGVVHESLKSSRGIGKPKEHDGGFKQSFVGNEGCLPLVTVLDSYIVVSPANVKLGENFGVS